ncbi:MAG: FAD-dependent oxidoreductase [Victivallales bacterium]|nr:FAD-dependent oxidoreductase [Victivallales bacterium]
MKYDVIVVGFGNGGMTAAIAAARQGAKVLVLERSTYAGGTLTGGGVNGFYGRHPYGLIAELQNTKNLYYKQHSCSSIEGWKIILEDELSKANGQVIYNAVCQELLLEGRRVHGIKWEDEEGLHQAEANVIIDATADARICEMAGCKCTLGRSIDNRCNTFTTSMLTARQDNVFVTNFDAGRINQYSSKGYYEAIINGLIDHIKDSFASDTDTAHYLAAADVSGLREGKHIVAEQTLTLADFFDGKLNDCPDLIGYAHSNIDIHANDMPLESTTFQDWMIGASMWGTEVWFPITRGSLVPQGYKGLLVAGRHFGCDHDYGQAVRMGDHIGRMGEAAGVMAALASDGDVLTIPMDDILSKMEDMPNPMGENRSFMALNDDEILAGLSSDKPGFAIWSARCRRISEKLHQWLAEAEDNSMLKYNAAFALALLGDNAAIPELLKLLNARDEYAPTTSRKYNHKRGYVAAYLLGRLAAKEAMQPLLDVIRDRDMQDKYEYHTHAIAALVRIANAHPETKDAIYAELKALANDRNWRIEARLKGTQRYVPVDDVFREYINCTVCRG